MSDKPEKLSEEEAIAKVILMGEDYQQESNTSVLWYAERIAFGVGCVGLLILISLFPYILMSKSGDYPVWLIVFAAFLIPVGIGGVAWVQVQEKRDKSDPFGF